MTENYKKRILFVGEASFLATGFSTYYRELLQRLAATGKYSLAEFGSYARQDHPEVDSFIRNRWKFYGNEPMNQHEAEVYQKVTSPRAGGQNTNQFGEYKFSAVLSDFQPDIVCFPPGTQIKMADGSEKNIEDVKTGDIILCADGKPGEVMCPMKRNYNGELIKIVLEDGSVLEGTPEHPILVDRFGEKIWILLGDLTEDDNVVTAKEIATEVSCGTRQQKFIY